MLGSPLGYLYLQDGKNYYYIHGAMHNDTGYQGRLVYHSSASGYNYIANLDDGIKFSGDVSVSDNKITNIKADDVKANSKDAVNGDQLYNEQKARTEADTAINHKIGTFDNSKTYNYIDQTASISTNLTTLDTHVKKNAEDISKINTRIDTLDGNTVKYDDSTKSQEIRSQAKQIEPLKQENAEIKAQIAAILAKLNQ